jgi:hypothetical protein
MLRCRGASITPFFAGGARRRESSLRSGAGVKPRSGDLGRGQLCDPPTPSPGPEQPRPGQSIGTLSCRLLLLTFRDPRCLGVLRGPNAQLRERRGPPEPARGPAQNQCDARSHAARRARDASACCTRRWEGLRGTLRGSALASAPMARKLLSQLPWKIRVEGMAEDSLNRRRFSKTCTVFGRLRLGMRLAALPKGMSAL